VTSPDTVVRAVPGGTPVHAAVGNAGSAGQLRPAGGVVVVVVTTGGVVVVVVVVVVVGSVVVVTGGAAT